MPCGPNNKTEAQNRNNTVINSIKTFKIVPIKNNKKKIHFIEFSVNFVPSFPGAFRHIVKNQVIWVIT